MVAKLPEWVTVHVQLSRGHIHIMGQGLGVLYSMYLSDCPHASIGVLPRV